MRWLLLAGAVYGGYTLYQGGFDPRAALSGGATPAPRSDDAAPPEPRAAERSESTGGRRSNAETTRERVLQGASRR
jgi:hypothetical protein